VEGEALEEGAAPNVWERVGIPEPPVYLGGLERGQRVVLGLLVVGGEGLGRPADHAPKDGLHVLILRRRQGHKASGAVLVEFEDPVRRQGVEMYVEVDRAPCPLDRGDAALLRYLDLPGVLTEGPSTNEREEMERLDAALRTPLGTPGTRTDEYASALASCVEEWAQRWLGSARNPFGTEP